MDASHQILLIAGLLCLCAIIAGVVASSIGMPLLLVFLGVGMLAGQDGLGGIPFSDIQSAYLIGSLALVAILFQGGLHTERAMIRKALWPSVALATIGVVVSAGLMGGLAVLVFKLSWPEALLLGAVTAPTDAAAVAALLRSSTAIIPSRIMAALEIESGLNDPMSVFLTIGLVEFLHHPAGVTLSRAALLFTVEMGGGALIGVGAGYGLLWLFRRLQVELLAFPVFAMGGALAIFGGAQLLGASGFLAVYLAGVIVGNHHYPASRQVSRFFGVLGWLAQIALFLMLGLLINPHELPPVMLSAMLVAAMLILVARPISVFTCLLPFRWPVREAAFVSWVGLRGAVPIYLTLIPMLAVPGASGTLFKVVFVVVVTSVAIQGWTINKAARLLRLQGDDDRSV